MTNKERRNYSAAVGREAAVKLFQNRNDFDISNLILKTKREARNSLTFSPLDELTEEEFEDFKKIAEQAAIEELLRLFAPLKDLG